MPRKPIYPITLALLLALSSSTVQAGIECEEHYDIQKMKSCAVNAYDSAKKELDQTYGYVKDSLNWKQKRTLKTTQDLWEQYRDTYCDFATADMKAQTLRYPRNNQTRAAYDYDRHDCLERLTLSRIAILTRYLDLLDI
jgi:uncharacterized protein YecT (DUF1311 family)